MKTLISLLSFLLMGIPAFSLNIFTIHHYSVTEGLPHNLIQTYSQDNKGCLWISTWNGLSKFDGYSFRNYKPSLHDKIRMGHNRIESISTSSTNKIWVYSYDRMIYLFDPMEEVFYNIFPEQHPALNKKVFCLRNGITWVLLDKGELYRVDENNSDFKNPHSPTAKMRYSKVGDEVYSIFQDQEENEWLLSSRGVNIINNGKSHTITDSLYHFIAQFGKNTLLASRNGQLAIHSSKAPFSLEKLPKLTEKINGIRYCNKDTALIITPTTIWIYYNTKDGEIQRTPIACQGKMASLTDYLLTNDGVFWAFISEKEILRHDLLDNTSATLQCPYFSNIQTDKRIQFIHEDQYGQIWFFTGEGLLCYYDNRTNSIQPASYSKSGEAYYYMEQVRNYFVDKYRNLWVSTYNGIDNLTFRQQEFEWIGISPRQSTNNKHTIQQKEVRGIFEDNHNNLWLSIKNDKIEIYDKTTAYVGNLTSEGKIVPNHNVTFGARIYSFYQDNDNNLWLGSKDKGLFVLYRKGHSDYIVKQYLPETNNKYSISSSSIYSIFQDSSGKIWIGSFGAGINLVEFGTNYELKFIHAGNELTNYPIKKCSKVRCLYESKNGTMMVGTTGGLITFPTSFDNINNLKFHHNIVETNRPDCLSNNDIFNIKQDRRDNIYISTISGGLDVISPTQNLLTSHITFKNYNKDNGLSSDVCLSSIEDLNGNIWVASPNSFTKLDVQNGIFESIKPDILKEQIDIGEALPLVDHNGNLIFGTTNGALRLFVEQMQKSTFVPNIVFTDIKIQGANAPDKRKALSQNRIKLAPKERNLTISFAAIDFTNPKEIKYAYRMKEDSDEWIYTDNNNSVSFINISPGEHTLQIKSTNGDGVWTDNITSLSIYITPKFWETGYAWSLYVVFALLIILISVYIISYIMNLRKEVDFEHRLTEVKLRFFTDISHELRTPLTLIAGPIEEVLEKEKLTENGKENMHTAKRNTERMLKLVNQILDFRKIQNNKMKICLEYTDIVTVINKVYLSFIGIAAQKHINFTYDATPPNYMMYTDTDKIEKILFNLLSNAFKYTPDHRNITLCSKIEDSYFTIVVTDEGSGFDSWKKNQLFMRFESDNKADPKLSTGIGLALTKELVRLLQGHIDTESIKGQGSSFTVKLPIDHNIFAQDQNVTLILNDTMQSENIQFAENREDYSDENKEVRLLIIEDNDELRTFIKNILNKEYKIFEAVNGKEGVEKALEILPDIVVCDIMMPVMDGIEFLNTVKSNPVTSHIPVLFLTAKSSIDDQIKGMEYGADDYITKPFNTTYLKTKISALIKRRKALRDYYLSQIGDIQVQPTNTSWEPSIPQITHYDDDFIIKVIQGIEDNIENPEFKIETLAMAMNMSRSVFYRKIKAIVGLSPIDFVKNIRIKRVIQLIKTEQFSITEIAYKCGFSSSQYLSRVFKEVTGETPTDYQKKNKEDN